MTRKFSLGGVMVLAMLGTLVHQQMVKSIPAPCAAACDCKEYQIIRTGSVAKGTLERLSLCDSPGGVLTVIPHAWSPNGGGNRYARVCDTAPVVVQANSYKKYYWSNANDACSVANLAEADVLENTDPGNVTPQASSEPKITQKLCTH